MDKKALTKFIYLFGFLSIASVFLIFSHAEAGKVTTQVSGDALLAQAFPLQRYLQQKKRQRSAVSDSISEEDLKKIWDMLKTTSSVWSYIEDPKVKEYLVGQYIKLYKEQGIIIKKSPYHYVKMLDEMAEATPQMLTLPFIKLMQIVAVMEYDFDYGEDEDAIAQQVLGKDAYKSNRRRLGLDKKSQ